MSWLMFICLYTVGLAVTEAKFHHEVGPVQDDSRGLSDKAIQEMKQEILEQLTQSHDSKLEQLKQGYDRKLEQQAQGHDSKLEQLKQGYDQKLENLGEENKKLEKKMADCLIGHNTGQIYINSTASNQGLATGVVAFHARSAGFVGAAGVQIPFDIVDLNIGNAYEISGDFTAPVSGLYHFESVVLSDSSCGTQGMCLNLNINGITLLGSCSSDYLTSVAMATTVQLSAGDDVTVNFEPGCYSLHIIDRYNWFSGHLLYQSI